MRMQLTMPPNQSVSEPDFHSPAIAAAPISAPRQSVSEPPFASGIEAKSVSEPYFATEAKFASELDSSIEEQSGSDTDRLKSGSDTDLAATDFTAVSALVAAALALPGVAIGLATLTTAAHAETPPEQGSIDVRYLYYRDWQPGASRMRVSAPSFHVLMPLENNFAIDGAFVVDSISGASPTFHDTVSGASGLGVNDLRKAGDVKLTRYFDRAAVGLGFAYSIEHDYLSRTFSLDARVSTPDNNTTLATGVGVSSDDIDSVNLVARGRTKRTTDMMVGLTQVLGANDIVQSNVTYSVGRGYFDDPYKAIDVRPDKRDQLAWLTRWNHHFDGLDATLRLSARYYRDTFGIRALTVGTEWVQPYGAWTITPSLRYTTQAAADFYYGPPFPVGFKPGQLYSADGRLSAFGAWTPGIKLARAFPDGWHADFKVEHYQQRNDWATVFGDNGHGGNRDLKPLRANFFQFGIGKFF